MQGIGDQITSKYGETPISGWTIERTVQILEDKLRACVLDFGGNWEKYVPLVEFTYNNIYQLTIGMPPLKALYGKKGKSPISWEEVRDQRLLGPV